MLGVSFGKRLRRNILALNHYIYGERVVGPSGICVGWGIEINGRFEAERPPTSVGPPSGGRTATFVPLDLVVEFKLKPGIRARIQIWIRETACLIRPTLHLVGRWAAQTSRVWVSARSRPSPPLYPHFNQPSGFLLVSSTVWWEAATNTIHVI